MRKRSKPKAAEPGRPLPTTELAYLTEAMMTLAEVTRLGSLTRAARSLETTTSAVSKRLARLEDRLGVRLLERTTRRIALTEAGEALNARALRILGELADAEEEVTLHADAPRGTLRVSAPIIFGERFLVPHVARFAMENPLVHVDYALSDRFVDLVGEGFDCAIRIGRAQESSLVARRLGRMPSVVVASPRYLERRGVPRVPSDLVRHDCLRYSLVPASSEWRFRDREREVAVPISGRMDLSHGGAMREAAREGLGLARLPLFLVAEALANGGLVEVLEKHRAEPSDVLVVHPARRHVPRKVRAFVEHLVAGLVPELLPYSSAPKAMRAAARSRSASESASSRTRSSS